MQGKLRKFYNLQGAISSSNFAIFKSSGAIPMYFEGLAYHDIIICDEKGLGLKSTGEIMSDDSYSKITQTYDSRMTPVFCESCRS